MRRRILIIGDFFSDLIESRQNFFDSGIDIFCPPGVAELQAIWENSQNFDLIIINGYYQQKSSEEEMISLVKKIRENFRNSIIAIFININFNSKIKKAGCNFEVKKEEISKKIKEILF